MITSSCSKSSNASLGSLGYVVKPALRADEAVAQARRSPPALILMDLHLPDRDGVDALSDIRALPGCADIPAIAMSGMDEHEARNLLTSDFSMYVAKPIDLDVLERTVRGYMEASQARSIGLVQ